MSNKLGLKKQRERFQSRTNDDSWALVELHRWQYGHLPGEAGTDVTKEPLDVPSALRGMSVAFMEEDTGKWPSPFNVATVLNYAALIIERHEKHKS